MANTQFVVIAVNKDDLAAGAKAEELIDREAILSATRQNESAPDERFIFVDKSGLDLSSVGNEEIAKIISGHNDVDIQDEIPTSMDSFKASVARMRQRPKLSMADPDD